MQFNHQRPCHGKIVMKKLYNSDHIHNMRKKEKISIHEFMEITHKIFEIHLSAKINASSLWIAHKMFYSLFGVQIVIKQLAEKCLSLTCKINSFLIRIHEKRTMKNRVFPIFRMLSAIKLHMRGNYSWELLFLITMLTFQA